MDQPTPNDHPAWSPPLGPSPWSGTTPATAQMPCGGPVSTCCVPGSPTRPALWPWASPVSTRRPGGAEPGRRPSVGPGQRSTSWPPGTATRRTIASRQPRCRQATTRPRPPGPPRPLRPAGRPPHPAPPGPARRGPRGGIAADSGGLSVRTPDTGTPDTGTLGCPLDRWTDVHGGTGGADRATTGLAGVRTSSRGDHPLGG
jgi:hypothetical protein